MTDLSTDSGILPVIIGGDAGAYALGLLCYEAFGHTCICVANAPVAAITRSVFFETWPVPREGDDDTRLEALKQIAAKYADRELLVLTNSDASVDFLARHRETLLSNYRIPFPDAATIDLLGDKDSFARICASQGVRTPKTVVADLSGSEADFRFDASQLRFPVVAKPSHSREYERIHFPGKKKIWFIESQAELNSLWVTLRNAGFSDRFLVQEMIPGDDTQMRSLTFYVDSTGRVTLKSAAQVLLQDPSPLLIGNPVAMITEGNPNLWDQAERVLKAGNYRGFANFDIKVDPRDGTPYFLEVNPRIGRNCYYVVAAGANPMAVMAQDLFQHEQAAVTIADSPAVYTLVPVALIRREVKSRSLRSRVNGLVKQGRVFNPLASPFEKDWRRKFLMLGQSYNYFRKFHAHRDDLR